MKRISFATAILLFVVSAVSCKREYTCLCKEEAFIEHQYHNQNTRIETIEAKNVKQASKSCIAKNSEAIDEHGSGHKTICDVID